MDPERRRVVREKDFEEQLSNLICDAEVADEFTNAAEYVLSENPKVGKLVAKGNPDIWVLPMQPVGGRAVELYYAFTEEVVLFLWIVSYDESEG